MANKRESDGERSEPLSVTVPVHLPRGMGGGAEADPRIDAIRRAMAMGVAVRASAPPSGLMLRQAPSASMSPSFGSA